MYKSVLVLSLFLILQSGSRVFSQVLNLSQAGVIEGGYGITPNLIGATAVAVSGNYAYVVGTADVLEIIDITIPGLPIHKGSLANGTGGANILRPEGIAVSGNYVYITSLGGNALEVVDVSNPALPVHKALLKDGGGSAPYLNQAWGIAISGNYAYIASASSNALEVVDISNPALPVHKGSLLDGGGVAPYLQTALSVYISGNYAYVGSGSSPALPGSNALEIIDISNPALPVHKGSLKDGGGVAPFINDPYSVFVSGTLAYLTDATGQALEIVDVSNPALPVHKGSLKNSGVIGTAPFLQTPVAVAVSGNYAYVMNRNAGITAAMEVIDVSNPALPVHKSAIHNTAVGQARGIVLAGNTAYVPSRTSNSLQIIDITNPASPFIKSALLSGTGGAIITAPTSSFVSGNYAYVVGPGALEIVDVTNPSQPLHKGSLLNGTASAVPHLSNPTSIFVTGNYAYITDANNSALEIVDVSNPSFPVHAGSLLNGLAGAAPYLSGATSVFVNGNYAYIVSGNGLEIAYVSNPALPIHFAAMKDGGGVAPFLSAGSGSAGSGSAIYVTGGYAFITSNYYNSLEIVNVANPAVPVHTSSLLDGGGSAPYLNSASGIFVSGNYAYIGSLGSNALEIVDVTNPALPVHKGKLLDGGGSAPFLNSPGPVLVYGNTAFVGSTGGLELVDVTNPALPVHKASLLDGTQGALLDYPTSLFLSGAYLYVTNAGIYYDLDVAYLYGPSIASFSPASGAAGSSVTVSGQNFDTFLTATINGTPATITSVTATTAVITVPPGVTIGKIVLSYQGEKVNSATNFIVIPTAATATNILQTSFTAKWSDVGAATYYLDVSTDNFATFVSGYNNTSVGNTTSVNVTGLSPGTTYQYRVRSSDGTTTSANSNVIAVTTIPATPTVNAVSGVSQSGFTINWTASSGATGYYLDVALDNLFNNFLNGINNVSVASNSQIVTGAGSGVTYYYRVRSADASGISPSSAVSSVLTIPANPIANSASAITASGLTANWSAAPGATGYFIDLSTDNFITFVYNNQSVAATSFAFTGLSAGVTYQYRVRSSNASGSSGNSNIVSVATLPPAPVVSAATAIGQGSFTIGWATVNGAVSYSLDVSTTNTFATFVSGYQNINVGSVLSYAVNTNLSAGTTYYTRVRANDASGSSANSNTVSATTLSALPNTQATAITFSSVTTTSLTVNFISGNGSSHLLVMSANSPLSTTPASGTTYTPNTVFGSGSALGSGFVVGNVGGPVTVTGLSPASSYYFQVFDFNGSGGTENYLVTTGANNPVNKVTLTNASVAGAATAVSQTGFTANWGTVTGATSYQLDVSTDNFTTFVSGYNSLSVPSIFLGVGGLSGGTSYQYRVRAVDGSGASANSGTISVLTIPANPTASPATSVTQNSFVATWTASTGATGYALDVATNAGFTSILSGYNGLAVAGTSQAVTGLSPVTTYYFRVRAIDATGTSGNSSTVNVLTLPTTPVTSAATAITQTGFTANWNVITGASNYFIDVATDAAFTSILTGYNNLLVSSNSLAVTGLSGGTTYYYQVRAADATGSSPSSSPAISALTIPANPVAAAGSSITTTSFQASWGALTGATGYFIDVANDVGFTSLLAGYNNLSLSATSVTVSGLTAGNTYYYRVRSSDATGFSGNSTVVIVATKPAAPIASTPNSITQNSFTVSWSSISGAASYSADVATDAGFNAIVYNNINIGTLTAYPATSLSPNTTYYFRVRANNASGSSANSNVVSTTTLSVLPISQSGGITFSAVSSTSLTVNFTPGNGSSHLVVASANSVVGTLPSNATSYTPNNVFGQGSALGSGFVVANGVGPITVTGLLPETTYYFQVFDFNGSAGSENYLTSISLSNPLGESTFSITPLNQPTNLTFSNGSASSVTVSYTNSTDNPAGYLVIRSSAGAPSLVPVSGVPYTVGATIGNALVAYAGPALSFFDGGLPTGTRYYYNVFAYNGNGASTIYLTSNPLAGNVTLDVVPPSISATSNPQTISGSAPFNAFITDNVSVDSAKIFYRGISQKDFKSAPMIPGAGGNYSVQVQSGWYDSLGLEYYFWANDENGNATTKPSSTSFAQLVFPSISLPPLPTGTGQSDYRIVAFPFLLPTDNKVTTVYNNVPWNDDTKAGLWWWDPGVKNNAGGYDKYGPASPLQTVDPGKGYWAITSSLATPQLSNVTAPKYNHSNLYSMTLKPKWNEIGNPYPVAISWDEVRAFNPNSNFSQLNVYDGSGYKTASSLHAYEGGFVKNNGSSDITIQIPFPGQTSLGGRLAPLGSDISDNTWNVFLHITQEGLTNQLGGFGMHPDATSGADRYDNFNPPRFLDIPEVNFANSDFPGTMFSDDMVKSQEAFIWEFTPAGNDGKAAQLNWTPEIFGTPSKQLFLFDEERVKVIDMTAVSSYEFVLSKASRFRIFYGSHISDKITSPVVLSSTPYPNPVADDGHFTINLSLPDTQSNYSINLQLYNGQGEQVGLINQKFSSGVHQLEFSFPENTLAAGIYLYKLSVASDQSTAAHVGKIVKL